MIYVYIIIYNIYYILYYIHSTQQSYIDHVYIICDTVTVYEHTLPHYAVHET